MQTQKVKVVRSFYFDRKPLPVNTVIELPALFAREVIASNKAVRVEGDEPVTGISPSMAAQSRQEEAGKAGGHGAWHSNTRA